VYRWAGDHPEQPQLTILLRALDRFEPVRVAGTEGGSGPFFSPDFKWIGFVSWWADQEDSRSAAELLCPSATRHSVRGSVWLEDDTIVFSPDPRTFPFSLLQSAADGRGFAAVVSNPVPPLKEIRVVHQLGAER
jgi:hypothetical protein